MKRDYPKNEELNIVGGQQFLPEKTPAVPVKTISEREFRILLEGETLSPANNWKVFFLGIGISGIISLLTLYCSTSIIDDKLNLILRPFLGLVFLLIITLVSFVLFCLINWWEKFLKNRPVYSDVKDDFAAYFKKHSSN